MADLIMDDFVDVLEFFITLFFLNFIFMTILGAVIYRLMVLPVLISSGFDGEPTSNRIKEYRQVLRALKEIQGWRYVFFPFFLFLKYFEVLSLRRKPMLFYVSAGLSVAQMALIGVFT